MESTIVKAMAQQKIDANATVELHERQIQALMTPATELLYGGAAGGGKSYLIRAAAVHWCWKIPCLMAYLFRRTFPELWSNHMEGPNNFREMLAPMIESKDCRIVKNDIEFRNGSKIFLRHCQHDPDVMKYQGAEIHLLLMDELTLFTEYVYRFLYSRLRLTKIKKTIPKEYVALFPRIITASNPGGIGHHWVKRSFVDSQKPETVWRTPQNEGGMMRQFLPATVDDNPTLIEQDPLYLTRLQGLGDPALVKAMRYGDWNVVPDAVFGYIFRYDKHVIKPFPIPGSWEIWRGGDDGFASPASIHWITQNPDTGTFYVIKEIYKAGLLPHQLAYKILQKDRSIKIDWGFDMIENNEDQLSGELDSAAFSDTGTGTPSRAAQMNEKGCCWRPVEKVGSGTRSFREMRVHMMHDLLAPNPKERFDQRIQEKKPGIMFFDECTEAIRTIPTLVRDDNNIEDIDTDSEDHAFDSITYALTRKKRMFVEDKVYGL